MNEFVEECRSEWHRLGVPSPLIHEMASELAADLEEAAAEGASAEDVLGAGAFHPREFATAWAAERGVIPQPLPPERASGWRSRTSAVIAALALIAIAGAVLVIFVSPAGSEKSGLPLPRLVPNGEMAWTVDARNGRAFPLRVIVQDLGAGVQPVEIHPSDSGDTRIAGSVMLFAALAGIVLLTMWVWVSAGRSPRRRTYIHDGSSRQA